MPATIGAASGDDRRRVEVQPQRIGRRERGHDHLQPLERQGSCGQRGLRCTARRDRRVGGLPGAGLARRIWLRLAGLAENAAPQQASDLLEVALAGELNGVVTAVAQLVAGDLGDLRLDHKLGRSRCAARPAAPGEALHLARAEQAGPRAVGLAPA